MSDGQTIWVDDKTRDNLKKLAKLENRSMAAQIRHMVDRELSEKQGNEDQPGDGKVQSSDCAE
jgi:hypothetical protein